MGPKIYIAVVVITLFTIVSSKLPASLIGKLPDANRIPENIGTTMTSIAYEDPSHPGEIKIEYFANTTLDNRTDASEVTFHFYSRNNRDQGFVYEKQMSSSNGFNASKDTLFIIHGWKNNHESPVNTLIKNAALSKHDINVFVVDWSKISMRNYISAKWAVTRVGEYVADFIKDLQVHHRLQLSRTMLVGHSLGAHVSGNAGAALSGHLPQIVGLDPALPLFCILNTEDRLDPSDAKYVQVIHTAALRLGFWPSIGDSDFYPSGGYHQRGCGIDPYTICSHSMAYKYYAESIERDVNQFVSTSCNFYKTYLLGLCKSNGKINMGGLYVDTRASGNYYLYTNAKYPYGRGDREPSISDELEISFEIASGLIPFSTRRKKILRSTRKQI